MSPLTRGRQRFTIPANSTALLLIDVINDLAFDGAGPLVRAAEAMTLRLAGLKSSGRIVTQHLRPTPRDDAALGQMRVVLEANIRPSADLAVRRRTIPSQEAM